MAGRTGSARATSADMVERERMARGRSRVWIDGVSGRGGVRREVDEGSNMKINMSSIQLRIDPAAGRDGVREAKIRSGAEADGPLLSLPL